MKLTKLSIFPTTILIVFVLSVIVWGFFSVSFTDFFALFKDREFVSAVLFGLETSFVAVVCSSVLGIPAGFLLARSSGLLSKVSDVLFDLPIVIPPLVVGVLLLNVFNSSLINNVYSFVFTFSGAAIAQFFVAFPFTVKSSKSAFELIPPIYERIAMTLGARYFKSFFDTTFKLAFESIVSGLILTWLRSLGEFGATLIVGGGIAYKTENIPINIYLKITEGNFREGLAASLFVIAVVFIFVLFTKFLFKKKRFTL